jgi:rubrerythrin
MTHTIKDYICKRCGYRRRAYSKPRACSNCEGRNTFERQS